MRENLSKWVRPSPPWKRLLDVIGASVALIVMSPLFVLALLVVWLCDLRNPFFVSGRVGRGGLRFRFLKIRTMVPNAHSNRVDTTVIGDPRITTVGHFIRALKIDELPQLFHVIHGTMSLVGPRPNVPREVSLYTREERRLLSVLPGVTDYSSIVFSDLGGILAGVPDANVAYNQFVRPWKSRLGLHYIETMSFWNDLRVIFFTFTVAFARRWTLKRLSNHLRRSGASEELCDIATRTIPLRSAPPPGAKDIVTSEQVAGRVDEG